MAFRSPSDGAPISPNQPSFGTPGQTKVSGDRQRETTHEICCLAAEISVKRKTREITEKEWSVVNKVLASNKLKNSLFNRAMLNK